MRICIPTQTNAGLKASVHAHFGSAAYFTIYDTEKKTVKIIKNDNAGHEHGACHPMTALVSEDINAVVCAGMGARAVQGLSAAGIRAYRVGRGTVSQIIKQLNQEALEEITLETACSQHRCH